MIGHSYYVRPSLIGGGRNQVHFELAQSSDTPHLLRGVKFHIVQHAPKMTIEPCISKASLTLLR